LIINESLITKGTLREKVKFGGRPKRNFHQEEKKVWVPKTILGKEVSAGKVTSMCDIMLTGRAILEEEITEFLIPDLATEFVNLGQAKGKFGGGKRKSSKPTQKKTREGNKMSFAMLILSGNKDGIVGLVLVNQEKLFLQEKKQLETLRKPYHD